MRWHWALLAPLAGLFVSTLNAKQSLPQWRKEDLARLEKKEFVPGASILVETAEDRAGDTASQPKHKEVKLPELPPEPVYDPALIPAENLPDYFISAPKGYLIDPQHLLSRQEALDQKGFLDYHAKDSEIPMHIYLFDTQQKIPAPYGMAKLLKDRYQNDSTTCVVFYFVGDPTRTQLAFGGKTAVSKDFVKKSLEASRIKAMEKSEPVDQIESFLVQLSISVYWLEKEWQDQRAAAEKAASVAGKQDAGVSSDTGKQHTPGLWIQLKPHWPYILVVGSGFGCAIGGLFFALRIWRRERQCLFPVIEVPSRLGADYGAGVGAVLAFRTGAGAPSSQRDEVPDYRLRM